MLRRSVLTLLRPAMQSLRRPAEQEASASVSALRASHRLSVLSSHCRYASSDASRGEEESSSGWRRFVAAGAVAGGALGAAGVAAVSSSLSVAEMKERLDRMQVDYSDCVEKAELSERLRSATSSLAGSLLGRADALGKDATPSVTPSVSESDLYPDEKLVVTLFQTCSPSVVHIRISAAARHPFLSDLLEIPQGAGTGIVWNADGVIVTNYHVIRGAAKARVTLADGSTWEAQLVGADPDKDVAVLRLTGPSTDLEPDVLKPLQPPAKRGLFQKLPPLSPVTVGTSRALLVGQRAYAIGNPFGLDRTLTQGIVSGVGRDIKSLTGRTIRDVIQIDAAINPGNSGGPLLDSRGRVIGLNTCIYSTTGASAGVGFAIPVDTVSRVVNSILRNGRAVKPSLGIHAAADLQARQLGLQGVLVIDVNAGSGGAKAGLRGTSRDGRGALVLGDTILAVGGRKVGSVEELQGAIEEREPGERVALLVEREGKRQEIVVTLDERKQGPLAE